MINVLNYYGGTSKLRMIIQSFRQKVLSNQEIKHFLLSTKLDALCSDQINYFNYIFPKPDHYYQDKIRQTAPEDYRIPSWQFEKVVETLQKVLADEFNVLTHDVAKLSSHILELIEESRTQADDMLSNIWKPADVNLKNLKNFYESNGLLAKIDWDENDVKITKSIDFPIAVKVMQRDTSIVLHAQSTFSADLDSEGIEEMCEILSQKFNRLQFTSVQRGTSYFFSAKHILPFDHYVPTRLLLRVSELFSSAFAEAHDYFVANAKDSLSSKVNRRRIRNEAIIERNEKATLYKDSPSELINDLKNNKVDEMLVLALFENHYKVNLEILHADVNRYIVKTKDKTYSYDFQQLKTLITKKLEQSE